MELPSCGMDSNEWEQLACIKNFLNHFETTTKALSETYYPTTHFPILFN